MAKKIAEELDVMHNKVKHHVLSSTMKWVVAFYNARSAYQSVLIELELVRDCRGFFFRMTYSDVDIH